MLPKLSESLQEDRTALKKRRPGNLFVKSTECKAFVGGTHNKSCEIDPTKVQIFIIHLLIYANFNFAYMISMLPGEIVKIIMDFSVAGKRKLDVGFYSRKKLDQICEGIQRRKFLTLINTITVSLFNTILFNKMELGEDTNIF